jgi:phosphatidylglycerophosphate synthase
LNVPNVLHQQEIECAKNYRYNGVDDSILGKLVMRHFWTWLIDFCPMWIAPNVITLLGLVFECVSFGISFYLSDGLTKPLPGSVCVFNGVCLFIYQTLDSLDGKQARRTGSSSPLGQFFDHGCDALTTVFEMMKVAASLQLGNSFATFTLVFVTSIGFFFTSFQEYVTHTFYMGYINGPTEGLILLMSAQAIVGLFPDTLTFLTSRPVGLVYLTGSAWTILYIVFACVSQSISDREKRKRAVIGVVPAAVTITIFAGYLLIFDAKLLENPFFTMSAGFILEYQAQQGIVGHLLGRNPWTTFWDPGVAVALGTALIPAVVDVPGWFWAGHLVVVLAVMLLFDVRVIRGFSEGLRIPIFTLPKRK